MIPSVVPLLNNLYAKNGGLFHNFFCPSVKLLAKERIGSKTIKHHDSPKTPYQRVIDSPHVLLLSKKNSLIKCDSLTPFT